MTWRNCAASMTLLAEVNARWPGRDRASDGTIGDAAHATRTSDHNPWVIVEKVGVVRARDIDKDGIDAPWLAEFLRKRGHVGDPRLAGGGYLIFNRRITGPDFSGWKTYTGSNPHTAHLHVSFSRNRAGFDSTAAWGITAPAPARPAPTTEDDMFTDQDRTLLQQLARRDDVGHARNQILTALGIDDPVMFPPLRTPEENAATAPARRVDVGYALDQMKAALAGQPAAAGGTPLAGVSTAQLQQLAVLVVDELGARMSTTPKGP